MDHFEIWKRSTSILEEDQPWANRSRRSLKKINRVRIDPVELLKRERFNLFHDWFDLSIFWSQKNDQFERKTDDRIPNQIRKLSEVFGKTISISPPGKGEFSQIFCCAKVDVTKEAQVPTYEIFWNIGHAILLSGTLPKKFSLTAAQYSQRRCVVVPGSVSRLHGQPVWISARGLPTVCEGRQIAVLILYK